MRRLAGSLYGRDEMELYSCPRRAPWHAVPCSRRLKHTRIRHRQTSSKGREHAPTSLMTTDTDAILARAASGAPITDAEALALAEHADPAALLEAARARRDIGHPAVVSYSPKVFIPLTQLCRDVCRYCTFAQAPRDAEGALSVGRRGHRDRRGRRPGRLPRGAVHARRPAGAPLSRGARGAGGARSRDDDRLSRARRGAGSRGDRAAAARQSRRDDPKRISSACARCRCPPG